jgi:hypothetical protein
MNTLNFRIPNMKKIVFGFLFFEALENVNALQTLDTLSKFKIDLVQFTRHDCLAQKFQLFTKTQF